MKDLDLEKAKTYWQRESFAGDQVPLAKKTILILIAEVEKLQKESATYLGDAKDAFEEIEKLHAYIEKIGTEADPMWVEACRLKAESNVRLLALQDGKVVYEEMRAERDKLKAEIDKITLEDGHLVAEKIREIDKLREALEEAKRVFNEASEERYQLLDEWRQEAEKRAVVPC